MDSSPSKRRKTSPTTFATADAPTTPSRIPIRKEGTRPLSGRPSFASPTKASISKHHPQLLRRPSSAGSGAERPTSRARDIQDVFTRALGEPRPSIEENEPLLTKAFESTTPRGGSSYRRAQSDGSGLSVKPRRMSRSPFKQHTPRRTDVIEPQTGVGVEMQENPNPFAKRGLRRSPVGPIASQASVLEDSQERNANPFEKKGLRRSPVSSQAVDAAGNTPVQIEALPELSVTLTEPRPSGAADAPALNRTSPIREPDPVAIQEYTTQPTESITPSNSEIREEPPEQPRIPPNTVEQPPISRTMKSINIPGQLQQKNSNGKSTTRRQARSSQTAERATFSPRQQPVESELPPTPTQLGIADPVVTTPPTGIHDTPSKSRARRKSEKTRSSPLKPRDLPPTDGAKTVDLEPRPRSKKPKTAQRRRSSRFLVPEDPHAFKKKTRDALLKELQGLQADVSLANEENERLRLHYEAKKSQPPAPSNPDELLGMLLRATASETSERKPKTDSIFKSIDLFLPFKSRRKRQATFVPDPDKPIPSHLPIALDDPLPYLQAFSPLTYISEIILLPPEPSSPDTSIQGEDQSILQRHLIKASHPSGLFSARLSMTIDTSQLSIASLNIEALPLSAEKELGTFMRERSSPHNFLNRDIGVVCWAMGRWVEVSAMRARFWCTVEKEFGTLEARVKSLQRKVQKRKRRPPVVDDDMGGAGDGDGDHGEMSKHKWTIRQLLPHMGRTSMELGNEEVELRFEWRVGFDWTGEVDSFISASVRLPESWQKEDDRKSLQGIPKIFDQSLKEKNPLSAVRTVVGLLMPAS